MSLKSLIVPRSIPHRYASLPLFVLTLPWLVLLIAQRMGVQGPNAILAACFYVYVYGTVPLGAVLATVILIQSVGYLYRDDVGVDRAGIWFFFLALVDIVIGYFLTGHRP